MSKKKNDKFNSSFLRYYRKLIGMNQQTLADKINKQQGHISSIETGIVYPSKTTAKDIAKALELPVSIFYEKHPSLFNYILIDTLQDKQFNGEAIDFRSWLEGYKVYQGLVPEEIDTNEDELSDVDKESDAITP